MWCSTMSSASRSISGPARPCGVQTRSTASINIITRSSAATTGGLVAGYAGTQERGIDARYGGRIRDGLTYRLYVKALDEVGLRTPNGKRAEDGWAKVQGGFRIDWAAGAHDALTLQGDAYEGSDDQPGAVGEHISGRNLLARWTHDTGKDSAFEIQTYYDHASRGATPTGLPFTVHTYDAAAQENFALGRAQAVVAGAGVRVVDYAIGITPSFFFSPASATRTLANVFVQDTVTLAQPLKLTLGLKLEDTYYAGAELLPSVRLAWTPGDRTLFWAAISRAVRSPTPFDRDVVEKLGAVTFLTGNPQFQSETLIAYEAGTRFQMGRDLSLSVSGFFNDYERLRNIEPFPGGFLPLRWGNGLQARTYGTTVWADYAPLPWWRLSPSFSYLGEDASFAPGASTILGVSQLGDDPEYRASLNSSMSLGPRATLDADLRYVGRLPAPRVAPYAELDVRAGYRLTRSVQVSLAARNLIHDHHQEFAGADLIPRSVLGELQWRF